MLILTFVYTGLMVVLTATAFLTGQPGDGQGLLFFAGATAICAFFALKSPRHGFVGATVLSLLVVFSASARIYGLVESAVGRPPGLTTNVAALALSLAYLMAAHGSWKRYRRRMALEEMEREEQERRQQLSEANRGD